MNLDVCVTFVRSASAGKCPSRKSLDSTFKLMVITPAEYIYDELVDTIEVLIW